MKKIEGGKLLKKYMLFTMLLLLFGCGQSSNGTTGISEKINEHLSVTPYLPETDYQMGTVSIEYNLKLEDGATTKGEPYGASIVYLVSQDEKLDKELRSEWEEQNSLKEIIYGDVYMDKVAVLITVAPGWIGEMVDADLIEIEGHEVQYSYLQRDMDAVMMTINFDDISYNIQYFAETDDIEVEAKMLAKEIISNN